MRRPSRVSYRYSITLEDVTEVPAESAAAAAQPQLRRVRGRRGRQVEDGRRRVRRVEQPVVLLTRPGPGGEVDHGREERPRLLEVMFADSASSLHELQPHFTPETERMACYFMLLKFSFKSINLAWSQPLHTLPRSSSVHLTGISHLH